MIKKALWVFLMVGSLSPLLQAQRIEARFNKEFSTDSLINKTLGAGASFIMDMWHPNVDVQINFDYAGHKGGMQLDTNFFHDQITKFKFGVSALYSCPLGERFYIRVGGDVSFNTIHNRHKTTVISPLDNHTQTTSISYRGYMLGIGAVAQAQVRLGQIFRLGVGAIPTYLIPLSGKVDRPDMEQKFKKGIFVCQLQVGLEIRLSNLND